MRKIATIATTLTLLCVAAFAQEKGTFTDPRDKKAYKTVKIGEQTWMAENLNYNEKGSECANCNKYGRRYNWEAAMKACPEGWHLPTEAEWNVLMKIAGSESKLKAKSGWAKLPKEDKNAAMGNSEIYADVRKAGNGTDDYGFTALPFCNGCTDGYWWSASKNSYYDDDDFKSVIFMGAIPEGPDYGSKSDFYSVRCLQGKAKQGGSI